MPVPVILPHCYPSLVTNSSRCLLEQTMKATSPSHSNLPLQFCKIIQKLDEYQEFQLLRYCKKWSIGV